MDSSFWFAAINLGCSVVYTEGSQVLIFNAFLSLKIVHGIANCVDPDEMQHYGAFHLGLHCLPKNSFRDFWSSQCCGLVCSV